MSDVMQLDRETILRAVRTWPAEEQRALAGDILDSVGVWPAQKPLEPPDSAGLSGLLNTGQPPPTGADVRRWLDERRAQRYGG